MGAVLPWLLGQPLSGQFPGLPQEGYPWGCIALGPQPRERGPVAEVLPTSPGTWSRSLHEAWFLSSFLKLKDCLIYTYSSFMILWILYVSSFVKSLGHCFVKTKHKEFLGKVVSGLGGNYLDISCIFSPSPPKKPSDRLELKYKRSNHRKK